MKWGSPPLTREPQSGGEIVLSHIRITPAHAGTTYNLTLYSPMTRDHPRSRGNHSTVESSSCVILGSPPLTREPLYELRTFDPDGGITPAHAGTTRCCRSRTARTRDHPRSRGNHSAALVPVPPEVGSPPLTREPQTRVCSQYPSCGITPAHAGTTPTMLLYTYLLQDHPRSRGNHSSMKHRMVGGRWITPAHAGTTIGR